MRGPEASGLLPASVEEAVGCTQWRELDCRHSLLLLIERERVSGEFGGGEERTASLAFSGTACQSLWQGRKDPDFTS